jgi:hypothetical protein
MPAMSRGALRGPAASPIADDGDAYSFCSTCAFSEA